MKRILIALCVIGLLAPVVVHLDVTQWRPERYRGYEDVLQVAIPAQAIAFVGVVGLAILGLVSLIARFRR